MNRRGFKTLAAATALPPVLALAFAAPLHARNADSRFASDGGAARSDITAETADSGSSPSFAPDNVPPSPPTNRLGSEELGLGAMQSGSGRLNDAEFESAIESVFPMTPEMVRAFRRRLAKNEQANFGSSEPSPITATEMIALHPSSPPPKLLVAPGIATAVGFYDSTGAPWPVRQYVLGDGEASQIVQLGDGANTLTISPLVRIGWTNLVVALAEDPDPIVLSIGIDRTRAHFRTNIQVMRPGPNAVPTTAAPAETPVLAKDSVLLAVLSGTGPRTGAAELPVRGIEASAWMADGDIYIRSPHPLLSPSWSASISGPGGSRAYKIRPTSVLLFSVGGRIVAAELDLP